MLSKITGLGAFALLTSGVGFVGAHDGHHEEVYVPVADYGVVTPSLTSTIEVVTVTVRTNCALISTGILEYPTVSVEVPATTEVHETPTEVISLPVYPSGGVSNKTSSIISKTTEVTTEVTIVPTSTEVTPPNETQVSGEAAGVLKNSNLAIIGGVLLGALI